jgi:hypothetical protein
VAGSGGICEPFESRVRLETWVVWRAESSNDERLGMSIAEGGLGGSRGNGRARLEAGPCVDRW